MCNLSIKKLHRKSTHNSEIFKFENAVPSGDSTVPSETDDGAEVMFTVIKCQHLVAVVSQACRGGNNANQMQWPSMVCH